MKLIKHAGLMKTVSGVEVTDDAICKSITGGKVNHWPKKGKLPTSKLTFMPTTHNYEVATGLARFIYCVGNKVNFDFGTYIFQQTVKHAKTLAIKMPIAFPSLLCGIIVNQRPDCWSKPSEPIYFHSICFRSLNINMAFLYYVCKVAK
ncbi:hypothetical protein QL285_008250 [Trifolium repens]|nr:hypothetical protein QL285_008250 [Trifolium repens]